MKKKPVNNSNKIAVTFEMPADIQAESLYVVGDFNDWNQNATPMKRKQDGTWYKTMNLIPGTYRYRYLADGHTWHNDWAADRYEPSELGEDNSVVEVDAVHEAIR